MALATRQSAGRGRALAVIALLVVIALGVIVGVVLLVINAVDGRTPQSPAAGGASGRPSSGAAPAPAGSRAAEQDALAAKPMLTLPQSAAQPQPVVAETAGPPIAVPAATSRPVPGGPPVPTGFPHTPEGALGQLAAINETALSTTDLGRVHEVYAWAAAPGAVAEREWKPTRAIATLVDRAGSQEKALQAHAVYQAVQGQIKGTVGPDFVVACVLGEETVTVTSTARVGWGDCQRMVWSEGRWRIGPGAQPAPAPSAWPGSADAVRAGWREIRRA